ncbi:MAG: LTA synthase family protein [Phocaeicola sp.]
MKQRIVYLLLHFLTVWVLFIIQKPLFMIVNDSISEGVSLSEYLQVMLHGASLDATTAGYTTIIPLLLTLLSIGIKSFPLRRLLRGYLIVLCGILSLIFVVDAGLYSFWGFKLDASIFLYLDSPKDAMASVSVGFLLLRFIIIVLLSAATVKLLLLITPQILHRVKYKIVTTLSLLLLAGLLLITIRGGVHESTANIGQVYFCDKQFLNHSAVNPTFSLLSSLSKSERYEEEFNFFDEEKRAQLFEGLYPATSGDSITELLNTKRPNILVILWEGLGSTFVESLGGVKGVTPNFNRLSEEGVLFTHCYANSFRTDRGTLCTFSGHLGFPTLSVMKIPAKSRMLPSFTSSLREVGYTTDFLYGGDINFTNMKSYLLSKGYQRVTSDVNFSSSQRKTGAWGVTDSITFNHLYNELVSRSKETEPWQTAFLTLSSHAPFDDVPYHRLEDKITNSFAYTDHCLGEFIDKLKQTPLWKDLLIVCLPDHGFFYPREGNPTDPAYFKIPILWLGGAVKEPIKINKLMNQSDLAATLLEQLGVKHDEFIFSRNVLSAAYKYPFAFYTFSNGFSFQDSTGVSVFDNFSQQVTFNESDGEEARVERGKAILQTLYDDLGRR